MMSCSGNVKNNLISVNIYSSNVYFHYNDCALSFNGFEKNFPVFVYSVFVCSFKYYFYETI